MVDESLYLTTQEAALAVVATAMKKARLLIDTLAVNSILGGILFSAGGMLHVMVESKCPQTMDANPGYIQLLQGLVYPIGLFYVVIMGADLFNSNILFFSVGVARGAVTITDLLISWLVSWWLNLVGNIFVCYVICHFSGIGTQTLFAEGSRIILESKAAASFVETLLKGMAGNFFVCLAIYLQLMAKPLHVKFLMMLLPIFTFVAMGFTHSVADMYMIITGLINGANVTVATAAWKLFLPGALGNMIGGTAFGLVVPWYLHLHVVERDQRRLNLPQYDMRDEQPELNQDSRVVRVRTDQEDEPGIDGVLEKQEQLDTSSSSGHSNTLPDDLLVRRLTRLSTTRSHKTLHELSPSNVFPVYGMGPPSERERSIASGARVDADDDKTDFIHEASSRPSAEHLGERIMKTLSRTTTRRDLEASPSLPSQLEPRRSVSSITFPRQLRRFSFGRSSSAHSQQELADMNSRYTKAGITARAQNASNEAAGVSNVLRHARSVPQSRTSSNIAPDAPEAFDGEIPSTSASSFNVKDFEPSQSA